MDGGDLVVDALAQLGVEARLPVGKHDQGVDLVIEPLGTQVQVKRRALITEDVANRLLADTPPTPGSVFLVVGDRVTETARRLLTIPGAGYYDLRGHLALRSENLVIDADVEPVAGRAEREHALSGNAGLEVAASLLMAPAAGTTVRALARTIGRSASTVSEVLASLRRDGLVDERHRAEGPPAGSTSPGCPCPATPSLSPCASGSKMRKPRPAGRSPIPWRRLRTALR